MVRGASFRYRDFQLTFNGASPIGLNNMVFLSPKIVADILSTVIRGVNVTFGLIEHKHLIAAWKRYPIDIHQKLLSLLEKFDISVQLPPESGEQKKQSSAEEIFQTGRSLIPMFLGDNMLQVFNFLFFYFFFFLFF